MSKKDDARVQLPYKDLIEETLTKLNPKLGPSIRIFKLIMQAELAAGSKFLRDTNNVMYHFDGKTKQLCRILENTRIHPQFAGLLFDRYHVNAKDKIARHIVYGIESAIYKEKPMTTYRFVHYDESINVLYVNRYNGSCYKLDGKSIKVIDNGAEVLFIDDDKGIGVEKADIGSHGKLLASLVNDLNYATDTHGGLTVEDQKLLLAMWIHVVAFPDLLPSKPILAIIAESEAGKTTAIKRIQYVVHGRVRVGGIERDTNIRDFAVSLLRDPIALRDNVDSYHDWLPDALARYTTGGEWQHRKLFANDEEHIIAPRSFVAVTSRHPASFYRDDVASRLLLLRLERRSKELGFTNENVMQRQLDEKRPLLYGEWLHNLNQIVAQLPGRKVESEKYRLSDFVSLARIVGRVCGFTDEAIEGAFARSQDERFEFMTEAEPLLDIIESYLQKQPKAQGQLKTIAAWFEHLKNHAELMKLPWNFKGPQNLYLALKHKWAAFQRKVDIEAIDDGAHVQLAFRWRQ